MTFKSLVAKCTRHFMLAVPLVSAVVLLFSASSAIGAPDQAFCQSLLGDPTSPYYDKEWFGAVQANYTYNVRNFYDNGLKIPRGSETEKILVATMIKLQRTLHNHEIRDLLPTIFLVTGDELEKTEWYGR
jgi:hypothetical protein